ncbi:AAA family ATPase [Hyalangium sp.]|uniref:AAA family ATPase n=1 Tax=Hyalangium sp. TaxID=2028555 RepID=UPI002D3DA9E3|nr:AAA family ATPase [Hyalangium sp.]HYH95378.1 AAA family ATPase [Hyalangium sp.]
MGLLWPESSEETARNNLRQLLLRLKKLLGQECIESGDPLRLLEGLALDVLHLRALLEAKDSAWMASFEGELLQDFTYDGCSELSEWLEGWRLKLRNLRLKAMEEEVLRLEQEERLKDALESARRLLEREPKAETSYQHVMRLHHRLGDRAAALVAYRQCQDMVRQEFGAALSKETRDLAREIEHSEATRPRSAVPLSVTHPPVLAGREREWALMEEAWAARQPMIVDGESGVGKSRLVREFGYSRGRCLLINGRPGDQQLPFATHIRSLREVLKEVPDAPMQPWVRRELSRLLPGLLDEALPPPQSPQERTRLFSAVIEFLRGALQGVKVLVFDDAQYMDRDSAELGIQVHSEFREEMIAGRFPLIINVFRTSEAGEWERQQIQSVIESGLMRRVQVGRLDAAAVTEMLRGMGEPAPEQAAEKMVAYTGGNPLFIVETVRHRRQSGGGDGTFAKALSPPDLIRVMIEQRLGRLSQEALRLARVFAVARTDFSVELASKVLEVPVDQLALPWRELEEAHIIQGQWFVHDLVCEVLLATLPEPIRDVLTQRTALHRGTC